MPASTSDDVNRDAWLDGPAKEQPVVRIEDLTRALAFSALSLPGLRDLLRWAEEGESDPGHAVDWIFRFLSNPAPRDPAQHLAPALVHLTRLRGWSWPDC